MKRASGPNSLQRPRLMATNAVFSINSNLDTQDIITKMVLLEARPMDLVEAKKQIEEQKLSRESITTTLQKKERISIKPMTL